MIISELQSAWLFVVFHDRSSKNLFHSITLKSVHFATLIALLHTFSLIILPNFSVCVHVRWHGFPTSYPIFIPGQSIMSGLSRKKNIVICAAHCKIFDCSNTSIVLTSPTNKRLEFVQVHDKKSIHLAELLFLPMTQPALSHMTRLRYNQKIRTFYI